MIFHCSARIMIMRKGLLILAVCGMAITFGCMGIVEAAGESTGQLNLTMSINNMGKPKEVASTLKIVLFLTALSLLPGCY